MSDKLHKLFNSIGTNTLNNEQTSIEIIEEYIKLNNTDELKERVDRNKKLYSTDNLNYLYPNGHRITHQMRWFKGSRDRCLRSDIAA